MGKTNYELKKEEIAAKVKAAGGTRNSKSDMTAMTHSLLNTPEQEFTTYIKDVKEPVISKPVEKYRESLKPVLKQFGVDNAEMDKIQDVQFSKDHAEAFNELALQTIKDYASVGRKVILPINEKDESQIEFYMDSKPETVVDTTKIEQQADGTYKTVPTGKRKKTKAHKCIKASNKVPGWLVEETQI